MFAYIICMIREIVYVYSQCKKLYLFDENILQSSKEYNDYTVWDIFQQGNIIRLITYVFCMTSFSSLLIAAGQRKVLGFLCPAAN